MTLHWSHVADTARLSGLPDGLVYLYLEWSVLVLGGVFELDDVLWLTERILLRLTRAGL